jgi:hypothetical protein
MKITDLFLCHKTKDGNIEQVGVTLKFYNCVWDVFGSNDRRHTLYPDMSMVLFSPSGRMARECFDNNTTTATTFPIRLSPDIALLILRYVR